MSSLSKAITALEDELEDMCRRKKDALEARENLRRLNSMLPARLNGLIKRQSELEALAGTDSNMEETVYAAEHSHISQEINRISNEINSNARSYGRLESRVLASLIPTIEQKERELKRLRTLVILGQYDSQGDTMREFANWIGDSLRHILLERNIGQYAVIPRLKERGSLKKKVERLTSDYKSLSDITDVAGVRVITYLLDQVDEVVMAILDNFEIDHENSMDKRAGLGADRLGYQSVHLIISAGPDEFKSLVKTGLRAVKCEVQVRSILQHAWAEIEHDLDYKSEDPISEELTRRIRVISANLESADREFVAIRREIGVKSSQAEKQSAAGDSRAAIRIGALRAFIKIDMSSRRADEAIVGQRNVTITEEVLLGDRIPELLAECGIATLSRLKTNLESRREQILELERRNQWVFYQLQVGSSKGGEIYEQTYTIGRGLWMVFFIMLLLVDRLGRDQSCSNLKEGGIGVEIGENGLDSLLDGIGEVLGRSNQRTS